MAQSRKSLISLEDTPYYHCISRCVRRSYLCGYDAKNDVSYEHRKSWVEKRLLFLSSIFAIDICAYAVMSNHVHIVLSVNKKAACSWSTDNVLVQWHKMHKGTLLTRKYLRGESLSESELKTIQSTAEIYRRRLYDISWFMRNLNEYIARKANAEDDCTGRFWEGRFRSQALLTEKALLSCMAYVDLNPVRAKVATNLNDSLHTSINRRLRYIAKSKRIKGLIPFKTIATVPPSRTINFSLTDYCALLNSSIEMMTDNSSDSKVIKLNNRLTKLGINQAKWLQMITNFEDTFSFAAGDRESMELFKKSTNRKRIAKLESAASCLGG